MFCGLLYSVWTRKTSRYFQNGVSRINSLLDRYILPFTISPIQKRIYSWNAVLEITASFSCSDTIQSLEELQDLKESSNMIFEFMDLKVASPVTVSKWGMVYLEPIHLGWEPLIDTLVCKKNGTCARCKKNDTCMQKKCHPLQKKMSPPQKK